MKYLLEDKGIMSNFLMYFGKIMCLQKLALFLSSKVAHCQLLKDEGTQKLKISCLLHKVLIYIYIFFFLTTRRAVLVMTFIVLCACMLIVG